jgi:DNA uptake protein ComE-like DNA-binding protein
VRVPLLIGVALLLAVPAAAQPADTTEAFPDSARVARDAEAALDDLERNGSGAAQLAERLATLAEQPLDVNAASAGELAQIPALSPFAARNITRLRQQQASFASLGALRAAQGVTGEVLAQARPYLTVGPAARAGRRYPASPSFGQVLRGLEFSAMQRVTRRLDLGKGYDPAAVRRVTAEGDTIFATRYRGGPERIYTRLRARYERRVSLALTLDKDPGERFAWAPEHQSFGYDHVSGHVALRDFGRLKTVVAGDFTAAFGQGLTFSESSVFGKGRNAVRSVAQSGGGLDPYGSAGENRFFRGAAATVRLTPRFRASAFASRRMLDASLVEADTTLPRSGPDPPGTARVTALTESGLHRTPRELSKKDALGETLAGGALLYDGTAFRAGATGYRARFDEPIQPDTARLFQRFDFNGRQATAASLFGQVFAGDYLFFGEVGRAPGGAVGGIGGVQAEVGRFAEAVVLARHFPRDFTALHGSAFGERSGPPQNEAGLYTGLRLKPARRVTVKGYFDLYRFPWGRFAVPRPSSGYDARLVAEHQPRDWLSYYVQLRTETRGGGTDVLDPAGRPLNGLIEETRQSARLHVDYEFSDALRLRSRIEGVRYVEDGPHFANEDFGARRGTDYGTLLYQDVRWRPFEGVRLDARLAFFDTDSYAARVYAYENDLLYAFSVPALSGQGQRWYLLARWAPSKNVVLEAKYAATHFRGVETVGSGLAEVDGPRRREIRAQVRFTF